MLLVEQRLPSQSSLIAYRVVITFTNFHMPSAPSPTFTCLRSPSPTFTYLQSPSRHVRTLTYTAATLVNVVSRHALGHGGAF
ncbi:hypothetical protein L6452_41816 [Arctium lappa]|uniref:Uncharacterized protein n=1 Tax=Arctium lappa TaxID=4217 RepID=A0ACB8XH81_ARCLA|nr:hypothetical protein L6452_41816 [Arctium lappa]